jgi:predicted metal-dependent hydrolase
MAKTGRVGLPGGQLVEYEIRASRRCKGVRLRVTARHGLIATSPPGFSIRRIAQLVTDNAEWVLGQLDHFKEARQLIASQGAMRPETIELPAIGKSWSVEYVETPRNGVRSRPDGRERVIVHGAIDDPEQCGGALRRWLVLSAREVLGPWLITLSRETGLKFRDLTIRQQRGRWGSCSADCLISLNCKLLFLPRELVHYVLLHELCHTVEHNHSARFWAILRNIVPEADSLRSRMRDGWKRIPPWAQ